MRSFKTDLSALRTELDHVEHAHQQYLQATGLETEADAEQAVSYAVQDLLNRAAVLFTGWEGSKLHPEPIPVARVEPTLHLEVLRDAILDMLWSGRFRVMMEETGSQYLGLDAIHPDGWTIEIKMEAATEDQMASLTDLIKEERD